MEQKTDFLSYFWLISTKHHIKYGCLSNKERPIFHIFNLKNFLFISKKSHKASRENLLLFGVICQKPQGGGGGNTSYPSPNGVNFWYVPESPKMEVAFRQATHHEIYPSFTCIDFQVLLVLEKLPMFSIKLRQKGLDYTHQQNVCQL